MNLGVVIGPALAGALAGVTGAARVVELQAALSVAVALAIAVNPAFEARGPERARSVRHALREGTRALLRHRLLRDTAIASMLTNFSWGMMLIAFPLFAASSLHTGRNASGYLWAALAGGSIIGTFLLPGTPSRGRIARSYLVLALSALLWLVAGSLLVGVAFVLLSGITEGPAYSSTIAMRQRHAPPGARTQVLNTIQGLNQLTTSVGSVLGGVLHHPATAIVAFCVVNLLAAAVVAGHEA
jgi:MFS family permease